jgi:hypothetical protein
MCAACRRPVMKAAQMSALEIKINSTKAVEVRFGISQKRQHAALVRLKHV